MGPRINHSRARLFYSVFILREGLPRNQNLEIGTHVVPISHLHSSPTASWDWRAGKRWLARDEEEETVITRKKERKKERERENGRGINDKMNSVPGNQLGFEFGPLAFSLSLSLSPLSWWFKDSRKT